MPKANMCECKFGSVFTGCDGAQLKRELLKKKKFLLFHKHYETYFDPSNCSRYDCRISNTVGMYVAARVVQVYKAVGLLHFGLEYVVLNFIYLIGCTYVDGNVTHAHAHAHTKTHVTHIQGDSRRSSLFYEVTLSVIVKKKSSNKHVSNSEG